jgi:putative endonuclease
VGSIILRIHDFPPYFFVSGHWFVYIVRCSDGSLFTGVTGDFEAEIKQINGGNGASYTRSRLPVFLAYTEEYMNESDALRRAASIKRLPRLGKEAVLSSETFGAIGGLAFGL